MFRLRLAVVVGSVATAVMLSVAVRAADSRQGAGRQPIGGTLTPKKADERGWGWQVKAMMNAATPRPLYNRAKEALLNDRQITSYTISSYDPDLYCEVAKHFDYIWFEMQHSTMSWDKYYGNAGAQYLNGYTVSADTRMVQNGPACDGWTPPGRGGRGRGANPDEEPVVGLPTGGAPTPATGRSGSANCWK